MKIFTAHRPPQASLEEAVFIKEGFSWPAFFFPVIWLVLKRLWLPLILYLVGIALVFALSARLSLSDTFVLIAALAMNVGAVPWRGAGSLRKVHSSAKMSRRRN